MGYAGGTKTNPTYRSLGDHTETIQVVYDPEKISYEELLEVFWKAHDPTRRAWSRQYMSLILTHDGEQERLALAGRERIGKKLGEKVKTEVRPFTGFTLAENYHQKYYLQHNAALMAELKAMYPGFSGIVDSTAAARMNGYVSGYGSYENLVNEIKDLGLSKAGEKSLLDRVYSLSPPKACGAKQCS